MAHPARRCSSLASTKLRSATGLAPSLGIAATGIDTSLRRSVPVARDTSGLSPTRARAPKRPRVRQDGTRTARLRSWGLRSDLTRPWTGSRPFAGTFIVRTGIDADQVGVAQQPLRLRGTGDEHQGGTATGGDTPRRGTRQRITTSLVGHSSIEWWHARNRTSSLELPRSTTPWRFSDPNRWKQCGSGTGDCLRLRRSLLSLRSMGVDDHRGPLPQRLANRASDPFKSPIMGMFDWSLAPIVGCEQK
jgi:hypothetical protein